MRRATVLGVTVAAWAVLAGWADAMVYVPMTFKALVTEARVIVVGRVAGTDAQWTDGRRSIETLVTIDVEQYLKGDMGRSVTIRVPGGQVGPYLSLMPGAPDSRPATRWCSSLPATDRRFHTCWAWDRVCFVSSPTRPAAPALSFPNC